MQEKKLPAVLQTAIRQQSIDCTRVNLMLPTESFGEILGEYDKVVIEVVNIDSNEKSGDVFSLGGKKALSKIPLQKIGNALGIIWDPSTTTIIESTSRKSRAKATGAIKKPNGEYIVLSEEKTVDVDIYQEEQQVAKEEEALKGPIVDWETNSKTGKKYPVRGAWKNDQEKKEWVSREVQKAVLQYRKFKDERAMTGAKTRVIRALIAIKGAYTDEELSLPFAFPKIIVDTNKLLANPEMRQAAIRQMTGNINSIFGEVRNVTPSKKLEGISAPEDAEDAEASAAQQDEDSGFEDVTHEDRDENQEAIKALKLRLDDYLGEPRVQKSARMVEAINKRFAMIDAGTATVDDLNGLIANIEKALGGGK